MSGSEEFFVDTWQVRSLGEEDEKIVQELVERCADYTRVVEGRPPGPNAAREFFEAAPENRSTEDVLKLGVFAADGGLVGLVEAARNYPAAGDWHLGLMLLDPQVRNGGLGARLYYEFERLAFSRGVQRIVLSVVEDNEPAHRFWRRMGFIETRVLPPRQLGDKYQSLTEMDRNLTTDATVRSSVESQG